MNKLKKGTMISKIVVFIIFITVCSTITIQTAFSISLTNQYFFVNGTKIEGTEIFQSGVYTYIPGEDVAKAMGDEVEAGPFRLIIKHRDKKYEFRIGALTYKVNDEIKSFSTSKDDEMRGRNNKLYVPMEILESELGYTINHDEYNIWVGNKPDADKLFKGTNQAIKPLPPNAKRVQWTTTPITENMQKQYSEWTCPQLKSTSVDDVCRDAETLIKELEFVENGYTSAKYDPIGGSAAYITAAVGAPTSDEFSSIYFNGYYIRGVNNGYMDKINKINPQILKFYFPNSWEWIHNKFMDNDMSINNKRMTIDGRDTYFSASNGAINISFSKVGGQLEKSYIPENSGTIGTAPAIDKGYWCKDSDKWSYKNSNGSYVTGWLEDDGYKYYFDDNGVMETGWVYYSGFWHYMWSNGQMATDTVIDGCKIDKDGTYYSNY